jgi:hypothetical protein
MKPALSIHEWVMIALVVGLVFSLIVITVIIC